MVLGGSYPGGNCPGVVACPTEVIVLRGSCPRGSCPQGSCPRGSCPRGSCPRTPLFQVGMFCKRSFWYQYPKLNKLCTLCLRNKSYNLIVIFLNRLLPDILVSIA